MKDTAQFFKILADETRLEILWLLLNRRELCVCEIMDVLDITQSKASRHLATMFHAGLVSHRKEGLWSYYSLRSREDLRLAGHLELLKASIAQSDRGARLLAKLTSKVGTSSPEESCPRGPGVTGRGTS